VHVPAGPRRERDGWGEWAEAGAGAGAGAEEEEERAGLAGAEEEEERAGRGIAALGVGNAQGYKFRFG
jgi:hypothetical protein